MGWFPLTRLFGRGQFIFLSHNRAKEILSHLVLAVDLLQLLDKFVETIRVGQLGQ